MANVDPALRERLIAQRKRMQSGGMLISNKGFTRMRLRVLPPRSGELPGAECISFFSKQLKKGTTSPMSWGVPCPVSDALARINLEEDKGVKDFAREFINRQTEYWMPVIDRTDEGTPEQPRLRVLRAKTTVYQPIIDWMVEGGEDEKGEDVTHPKEGKDLVVKRTGTGLETEWKVDKLDRSPISEDKVMAKAWVELSQRFDVRTKFFAVDKEILQEMYKGLTGEEIPDAYIEAIDALIEGHVPHVEGGEDDTVDPGEGVEEPVEDATADAPADDDPDDLTGRTVTFDNDGTDVQGTVSGVDAEDEGNWLVVEDGGDANSPWSIPANLLTVVEAEAEPEEEVEPEPVKAPAKRTLSVKTNVKPPTAAPAKAAPPKPAPAKVATKPTAMPRKPAPAPAPAVKGKAASSTIKDKMKAKK